MLLRPEYHEGKACGNCILLRTRITQPETERRLEETLRSNAATFVPKEILPHVRIVTDESDVRKYWSELPANLHAVGWVYIPPEPVEIPEPPRRRRTAAQESI